MNAPPPVNTGLSKLIGVAAILLGFAGLTVAGMMGFAGAMPPLNPGSAAVVTAVLSVIAIAGGIWELSRKPPRG